MTAEAARGAGAIGDRVAELEGSGIAAGGESLHDLLAGGAKDGEPPTPETIRQGTVRMEDHPRYHDVVDSLPERGFTLRYTGGDPYVEVVHVLDARGNVLRVERFLNARPGMRYLDLEHELDHVEQVTTRFPEGALPTRQVMERPDGTLGKPKMRGPSLKVSQNAVLEYHVRLTEYIRLSDRGVDGALLREHAEGVRDWRGAYYSAVERNPDVSRFARDHFSDIQGLQDRADGLIARDTAGSQRSAPDAVARSAPHGVVSPATAEDMVVGDPHTAKMLAAGTRTPDGLVDSAALATFIEAMPQLDVADSVGLRRALDQFVTDALGREVSVSQLTAGAGKGQSGAPVFLVHTDSGEMVAITKVFPAVEELARELSAIDRLGAREFTRFRVPEVLGVAIAHLPSGRAGVLTMSVAKGRSLFDMIQDLPSQNSPERLAAFAELTRAVGDAAAALAELHSRPVYSGGSVNPGFLEFNHHLARRETEAVAGYGEVLWAFGVDGIELSKRVGAVLRAALADPGGAAIIHGDAHPGNIFWHSSEGVTFIDTPHSHFSMDQTGCAIGSPARDFSNMMQRLAHFSLEAGLTWSEVEDLQIALADAYRQGGGPVSPEPALTAFAVRFAVRDVLDTLTSLEQPGLAIDQGRRLRRELATELRLLRLVLGWKA